MNRDNYSVKDDEEVYFDCKLLEKFDEKEHKFDSVSAKKDAPVDIMDFISKSDFTSVGGLNNTAAQKQEEAKVDIRTSSSNG